MSLLNDDVNSITLAADSESERAYQPDPERLRGCLLLGDRGYQDRTYFTAIVDAGGSFIIRGMKCIHPTIRAAFRMNGAPMRRLEGKTLSWDMLPNEAVDLDIEWRISKDEVYRGRIVVLYKKNKRNEKMFIYLHTNLARERFSAENVAQLYRLRWQVELLFKECKSHANLHVFDTANPAIAEGLIWASLLAALLKRGAHGRTLLARGAFNDACRGFGKALSRSDLARSFFEPRCLPCGRKCDRVPRPKRAGRASRT